VNILFLSDVYFPRINGVSTSIHALRQQLLAQGHQVRLIAPDYYAPSDDESWIVRVPSHHLFFDPEDRLMRYRRAFARALSLMPTDVDLIHIHTPFAAHYLGVRLAKWLKVPCVETYHTFFEDYLHHYLPLLPRPVLRFTARHLSRIQCNAVDAVVAPSQPMLEALRSYGVNSLAAVIPTGLEAESFVAGDGAAFRRRYGIDAGREVLLYVGRVAHEKNIGFLLRMLDDLRRFRPGVLLVIAGEGPALEAVQQETAQLGLLHNVLFIGYLDRATELNDCYAAADIFVFSSLTETQGLVLLEAMAQGVPVVAVAEMGTKSILCEGVGAHIAPHDASGFSCKVRNLLADGRQRIELGALGREYARQWSAASMTERMLAFYRQVMTVTESDRRAGDNLGPDPVSPQ